MMKLFRAGILALTLALSTGIVSFAAVPGTGTCFVDEDGDGICDRSQWHCVEGVCCGAGERGCGLGFIDEDGDGICDRYAAGGRRYDGTGRGRGCRESHHRR